MARTTSPSMMDSFVETDSYTAKSAQDAYRRNGPTARAVYNNEHFDSIDLSDDARSEASESLTDDELAAEGAMESAENGRPARDLPPAVTKAAQPSKKTGMGNEPEDAVDYSITNDDDFAAIDIKSDAVDTTTPTIRDHPQLKPARLTPKPSDTDLQSDSGMSTSTVSVSDQPDVLSDAETASVHSEDDTPFADYKLAVPKLDAETVMSRDSVAAMTFGRRSRGDEMKDSEMTVTTADTPVAKSKELPAGKEIVKADAKSSTWKGSLLGAVEAFHQNELKMTLFKAFMGFLILSIIPILVVCAPRIPAPVRTAAIDPTIEMQHRQTQLQTVFDSMGVNENACDVVKVAGPSPHIFYRSLEPGSRDAGRLFVSVPKTLNQSSFPKDVKVTVRSSISTLPTLAQIPLIDGILMVIVSESSLDKARLIDIQVDGQKISTVSMPPRPVLPEMSTPQKGIVASELSSKAERAYTKAKAYQESAKASAMQSLTIARAAWQQGLRNDERRIRNAFAVSTRMSKQLATKVRGAMKLTVEDAMQDFGEMEAAVQNSVKTMLDSTRHFSANNIAPALHFADVKVEKILSRARRNGNGILARVGKWMTEKAGDDDLEKV